ncbi:TetR/AcrR family transcriptional regulator C-terminal domain-containing protein [Nocardiopsis halophila]|uniref:TetR/AcrR family transcriptional regulator C-terminal domain-containing protein n=1 Tax=Nocardiopsis halophila TaxID=141692 RepID=UPI00034A650B|nr:TetR/AcrR family transcriptional regulator C-terminal domain-containing protein [Nocardiopsis halophila]
MAPVSRNNAGLSTDRIIVEALRIIDGQGLRRLTMRRLGDSMEVEAMAVYHHFPLGKEQLFEAIAEYITDVHRERAEAHTEESPEDGTAEGEADEEEADERPWDERLRSWAYDYRAALLKHSGALPLLINRRPDTEAAVRSLELQYAAFTEAGLEGRDVVNAAAALESYVTGAVVHEVRAGGLESPHPARLDGRFPTVTALRETALDHEQAFAEGLERLLKAWTGVGPDTS